MIVFINCYEEMASGMRTLAALAQDQGWSTHICVLHGYKVETSATIDEHSGAAHVCVNSDFHVNSVKARPFKETELELLRLKLIDLQPQLICVSTRSTNDEIIPPLLNTAGSACPDVPIVCGGYGPTYNSEHYLRNGADLVIRGEGEIPFMQLLDNLKAGKALTEVSNASFLKNGEIVSTSLAPPLSNISSLPSPLVGDDKTTFIHDEVMESRDPAYDNKTFNILLGRGCIGSCSYCAAPVLRKVYAAEGRIMPKYRRRGYDQILRELEEAKQHGAERIFFKDEYLVDEPARLADFFRIYQEKIDLPFRANLHSGQLLSHPELLQTALAAGLYAFTIGFQSGTESMSRHIYDRPHKFEDWKKLANILYDNFVSVQFHFVSGTSLNSQEEFEAKCKLIASLPYDPIASWHAMCMDFQFYPQPLSLLSQRLEQSRLQRVPVRKWAYSALLAQIHHFAKKDEISDAEHAAGRESDPVQFLQRRSRELRLKRGREYYQELAKKLAGKDIIIMGDKTKAWSMHSSVIAESRIAGRLAIPGQKADQGRLKLEEIKNNFDPSIPILLFGHTYYRYARALRSRHDIINPVFGLPLVK